MSSSISPLFAVHAEQFLSAGMYAEALDLCLRGIEIYPHYPSAYALTARAMWALGNSAEAQEFIVNAVSLFPAHPALLRLEQEYFGLIPTPAPLTETMYPETKSDQIDLPIENEDNVLENDTILLENNDILLENNDILLENNDILLENDGAPLENSLIPLRIETNLPESEGILPKEEVILPEEEDITPKTENILPDNEDIHAEIAPDADEFSFEAGDGEAEDELPEKYSPLRIIETVQGPSTFVGSIKASTMNLIPGLDFTPLKFQNGHKHSKNGILPAAPPFPRFREHIPRAEPSVIAPEENIVPIQELIEIKHVPTPPADEPHKLTPLEELAARLEKVRIPATYEEIARPHTTELVPAMVTETMARIYEKQGAFPEAIKAYQILARRSPDKLEFYEERIREVQGRMMEEG